MSNDNLTPTDDMSNPLHNVRSWAQELRDTIANFKPMDEADAYIIQCRVDDYDRFIARIDREIEEVRMFAEFHSPEFQDRRISRAFERLEAGR